MGTVTCQGDLNASLVKMVLNYEKQLLRKHEMHSERENTVVS